jgi:glutamyl-tRNA synthetase
MEDLDRLNSKAETATTQLIDLAAVGVRTDQEVVFQSGRFDLYRRYVTLLEESGLTFECFCTRREIQESVTAPHAAFPRYPGTCRDLSESDRRQRSASRPAAIRLRTDRGQDENSRIDDIVLVRNDGVPAYNLAVVVDDELQGVTQVVRGEDLAHVTPSQNYLQRLLGFRTPEYVHLPLMIGPDGHRLSKRHGDVTLSDCLRLGFSATAVRSALLNSLELGTNGWDSSSSLAQWLKSLL